MPRLKLRKRLEAGILAVNNFFSSSGGFFFGGEVPEVVPPNVYAPSPSLFLKEDSGDSASVVFGPPRMDSVRTVPSQAQIRYSVVSAVAVYVVNLLLRPFPVGQVPSDSVCAVCFPFKVNNNISGAVDSTYFFSRALMASFHKLGELSGLGVVVYFRHGSIMP